jgi:ABC-type lipoprotein release transport system permease subunit
MIKLAWRNIWRNPRRSLITMASVFFAVFFSTVMSSMTEGVWEKMIENTLRTQTGHIQIHQKGYWDDKVIDNFMTIDSTQLFRLETLNNIENVSPRVETFAMASFDLASKGVAVVGISPEKEAEKSNLPIRLVKGSYLTETDDGVLIGKGLSNYLKVNIGDTLAFIGQGYHGTSAAGLFPVRGILTMFTNDMDNSVVYITLLAAQKLIDMPDGYSGILIAVKDNRQLDKTMMAVGQALIKGNSTDSLRTGNKLRLATNNCEIMSWHFTMERLMQTAESDKAFSKVVLFILYLIVGFGILGTVIMLTNERKLEFNVMISLGMQRWRLALTVMTELLMMTFFGVILALMATIPLTHIFAAHPIELTGEIGKMYSDMGMEPIMPASTAPSIFVKQIIIVLTISILTTIYPIRKILKHDIANRL